MIEGVEQALHAIERQIDALGVQCRQTCDDGINWSHKKVSRPHPEVRMKLTSKGDGMGIARGALRRHAWAGTAGTGNCCWPVTAGARVNKRHNSASVVRNLCR